MLLPFRWEEIRGVEIDHDILLAEDSKALKMLLNSIFVENAAVMVIIPLTVKVLSRN